MGVLLANADGSYSAAVLYDGISNIPYSIASGDVNGDGSK